MRSRSLLALLALSVVGLSVGCSTRDDSLDAGPRRDGALPDGSRTDAPTDDGGLVDMTAPDMTALDLAMPIDMTTPRDMTTIDTGVRDMTTPDSTVIDLGPPDADGDGVPDATDDCPLTPNADQLDTDADGHGDVCDFCPTVANPGAAPCPATIYEVKMGTIAVGAPVAISDALVTAVGADGYFLQVKESDAGYLGAPFSGVFVLGPPAAVAVGDRVNVTATIASVLGETRLQAPTIVVTASAGEAPPAAIDATAAEVATGGTRAAALEAVLVHVTGTVAVTDVAPVPAPTDVAPIDEFVVEASLRVDDYLYLVEPFPTLGETLTSLTGVLATRDADSKLEPRNAADLVFGPPVLAALGPALSFQYVASSGPTLPMPLTVALSRAPAADTVVSLAAGDASLTVAATVTVLAGATTAVVPVTAVTASATATTITATLGTAMRTAQVRALDPALLPHLVSLTPAPAMTTPGGTITLTATLDIPAPAGGTVIAITVAPTTAATVPATITVLAGTLSSSFDAVDLSLASAYDVTATLGADVQTSHVTISAAAPAPLRFNELDYDQVGTDSAEYIEIYNAGSASRSLAGVTLYLVNGATGTVYATFDLSTSGSVPAGGYLVLAPTTVTVTSGAIVYSLMTRSNVIQNGPSDGMALVDTSTTPPTVIDSFSYEGGILMATLPGLAAPLSLVHGTASSMADSNTVVESLCRIPSGATTGNDMADWRLSTMLTPGRANM